MCWVYKATSYKLKITKVSSWQDRICQTDFVCGVDKVNKVVKRLIIAYIKQDIK